MSYLHLPDGYKTIFIHLITYTDATFDNMVATFESIKPSDFGSDLTNKITGSSEQISHNDIKTLIDALLSLYIVKANSGKEINEIIQDVLRTIKSDQPLLDEGQIEIFQVRLSKLLSINSMEVCAKATALRTEYDKVFGAVRVMTDLRPVFSINTNSDPSPIGIIITHNLKIEFLESVKQREFFVALDSRDIDDFIEVLNRAKAKEQALKKLLSSCGLENIS